MAKLRCIAAMPLLVDGKAVAEGQPCDLEEELAQELAARGRVTLPKSAKGKGDKGGD